MALARLIERIAVATGVCVLAVCLGVALLTAPWFTRLATTRLDVASQTGLPANRTTQLAEQARRFVTDANAPALPSEVDGRSAFGQDAVDHLLDVRSVVDALRLASIAIAAVLAIWFVLSMRSRRLRQVASALTWGGIACLALPVVLAFLGLLDFESLFASFHGVVFEAGTWTFPPDSLLIQLFPERFWMTAGAALALLAVLQGIVLLLLGRVLSSRAHSHEESDNQSPA